LHSPLLHAPIMYDTEEELFEIMKRILKGQERPLPVSTLRGISEHLEWSQHVQRFDDLFEEVAARRSSFSL
jgi:hypothetical protein